MTAFIVIIDDSLTMRKILETCLQREGYAVKSFPDGVEALRWLGSAQARPPDLIFLDLGLPKLDGYEVLRLLKGRAALAHTMLVILSGRDGLLDRLKARLAGAHVYLTKPCKTSVMLSLVRMALGPSVARNESTQGGPH